MKEDKCLRCGELIQPGKEHVCSLSINEDTLKCRSCGADIVWITYKGKPHPVNAKPKKMFAKIRPEMGNHGKIELQWVMLDCHESHFATCPDAGRWRK